MSTTRLRPSLPALAFLTWVLVAAYGFGQRFLNGDGDVARHLRHGAMILAHGPIRYDPFSFTKPGAPFVGFEYGAQATLALAERAAGLGGVVALGATLAALTTALLLRFMLRRGVEPAAAYLAATVAAVLMATHWIARPHLFSWLLLLVLLGRVDRPGVPSPWFVLGLFALWGNVHGGWVYGLALLGAVAVGRRSPQHALLGVLALAATVLNPYGSAVPAHVVAFVRDPVIMRVTHEFRPPTFHDAGSVLFLACTALALAGFASLRPRVPPEHLLIMLGFTVAGFLARRNIPLAALTSLPLAVVHLDPLLRRLPEPPNLRASFARGVQGSILPAAMAALVVWATALVGALGGPALLPTRFNPRSFPVAAVARLKEAHLTPRVFNEFEWGGYLVWADTSQRVFIDPGTDFYGGALTRDYLRVWSGDPGWRDVLARERVDAALVSPTAPIAGLLRREREWRVWYEDGTAVLLRRDAP